MDPAFHIEGPRLLLCSLVWPLWPWKLPAPSHWWRGFFPQVPSLISSSFAQAFYWANCSLNCPSGQWKARKGRLTDGWGQKRMDGSGVWWKENSKEWRVEELMRQRKGQMKSGGRAWREMCQREWRTALSVTIPKASYLARWIAMWQSTSCFWEMFCEKCVRYHSTYFYENVHRTPYTTYTVDCVSMYR